MRHRVSLDEDLLGRIVTGPHTGRKALTLRTVDSNPPADNPCWMFGNTMAASPA